VGCEQRPANEAERSSPYRVVRDRRQPATDVVQRAEQTRAATEHVIPAGDPGWGDKRKPVHTARLLRSQLGRDQPAKRMADEIHALELGRLEPTAEPTSQVTGAKPLSQPRQVEQVNTVTLGQGFQNRLPPAPGA
jgi:hypothetical protein